MEKNANALSSLVGHYDSDSDNDNADDHLGVKVDNFLQEIDKIVPPVKGDTQERQQVVKSTCAWQECYDESTGYPYYWNMNTNAVTWEMPDEYKQWLHSTQNDSAAPKLKSDPKESETVKSIQKKDVVKAANKNVGDNVNSTNKQTKISKEKSKSKPWETSDSEDEKIEMITSYCDDSSEDESNKPEVKIVENKKEEIASKVTMGPHLEVALSEILQKTDASEESQSKESNKDVTEEDIDETDILSRLRSQAKILKELGGEIPQDVEKLITPNETDGDKSAVSLVAGYGDDSEEEEEPKKVLFPINATVENDKPTFPAADVKLVEKPTNPLVDKSDNLDNKAFKRKRRIAFDVTRTTFEKRPKIEDLPLVDNSEQRKGLGYQIDKEKVPVKSEDSKSKYSGIAFVKAETLVPPKPENVSATFAVSEETDKYKDFDKVIALVGEKVAFLGEGKEPVSAVQIMAIQLQTLEAAHKAGGLSLSYLYTWLHETSRELLKLEQEAAPAGWQCQWDRSNKRYFYRNQHTGDVQWEYPQPDIVGGAEAMDICTTPPPPDEVEAVVTPPPPVIGKKSPSPPPPPTISQAAEEEDNRDRRKNKKDRKKTVEVPPIEPVVQPPLPPLPTEAPKSETVETQSTGAESANNGVSKKLNVDDAMYVELNSFYSDIASLESETVKDISEAKTTQNEVDVKAVPQAGSVDSTSAVPNAKEVLKKKKKTKTKIAQGLTMKKKGVSSLVEKWKKVQSEYKD